VALRGDAARPTPPRRAARSSLPELRPERTTGRFGCTWVGSVTIAGPPGSKLAALVNQANLGNPEALTTYGGR
jgi:hypothetical protein